MRSVLELFFSILVCTSVVYAKYRCDYTFTPEVNGWLKYHEMPSNWNEARLRCNMEDAILASPVNPELASAMGGIINRSNVNCAIFTGIHATFSRGDFNSIEGKPLEKISHIWAKGEPDNYKDEESCIVILPDGTIADEKCQNTFPYICYKKMTTIFETECGGETHADYFLDRRTGSCYRFHRQPKTWSRAFMTCQAEGGYLVIINSETEATVIKELFASNPGGSMPGNFWKDVAFVGFHDWTEHGDWRTIHGETLADAGYDKFSPGEPNNATTGEFCGAVYRSALFDDLWCENKYAFICEKAPDSLACDK